MKKVGYSGSFKNHPIYSEISIDNDSKIQFFDVTKKSKTPYFKANLWGYNLFIETIEEIIAKKIYFRAYKGNSRDLFDIAIAFHIKPDVLLETTLKKEQITTLFETVSTIYYNQELKDLYLEEIYQMNPNKKYEFLAINTIEYLYNLLESICVAYNILGEQLSTEDYIELEKFVYVSLTKNTL